MKIAIGTTNKAKLSAVENVVKQYFKDIEFQSINVDSEVSAQPFSNEETREGAINRAKNTLKETTAEWGFGLEGGVEEIEGILYCVNWGAVALQSGAVYSAAGAAFMLPEEIAEKLRAGFELGPVMDEYTNTKNIRQHSGAIGIFTNGLVNRQQMFEHIVTLLIGQVYYYEQLEKL